MDDLKDIYRRVLDTPAPPLRDASLVLATARADTRKRHRIHTVLAASLGMAMVASLFLFANRPVETDHPRPWLVATGAPTPANQPIVWPEMPSPQDAHTHGPRIAELLVSLVPEASVLNLSEPKGFGPTSTWSQIDDKTWGWLDANSHAPYFSSTSIYVMSSRANGMATVTLIADKRTQSTADFCTAGTKARLASKMEKAGLANATCELVFLHDVPIRVSTARISDTSLWMSATRFLDGGYVIVEWWHGTEYKHDPKDRNTWRRQLMEIKTGSWPDPSERTQPPVTLQGLVELAANPGLLP